MLFVKTEDLNVGMRIARPIYNRNGVMLYERNSKLTRQGIVSIENFGLMGIYILEAAEPVPPMSKEDIEFERFQAMAIFRIKEILDAYCQKEEPKGMYQFANQIIKKYGSLNYRINFIQNLRSAEDYVYKHSLNTAILSALMSSHLEMEFKQQLDVVVAAILHDIGTLLTPLSVRRKKKAELTEEDDKKIRTYHFAAVQLITGNYDLDSDIKKILRILISDLHEISYDEEETKRRGNTDGIDILKVAYQFDVMTAMNFQEEPLSEISALRYLLDIENGFSQKVVNALIQSVNILNPGVCVELTNGEKGLVIDGNDENILTPQVLSFKDNVVYNLSDRFIAKEIQIKDIMKTMDNRHVVDKELLDKYMGETVYIGERRPKKTY